MNASSCARAPSLQRSVRACRVTRLLVLPGLSLLLAACAAAPPVPVAGLDPADPAVRVRPVSYASAPAKNASRPVEVQDWRSQNQRVAPRVTP
jgi:hypothetical protein